MSTTTQPQPLSNRTTTEATETNAVDSIQFWYEKNKKLVNGLVVAVLVVVIATVGYFRFYLAPREAKAAAKVFYAQQYFAADSFQRALQGDGQHPGFVKVARDYSGTKTANLCHYYAGVSYLKTGDAKKAIKELEDFSGKGTLLESAAAGMLGAAYMDNGNTKKAIEQFQKASSNKEDNVQTPMYLMSLGTAYEMDKKPDEAKKAYLRIRDEYPASMQAREIDRNLARLGVLN
jgi:tetratricopeptide (TPR) repeat protein